MLRVGLVGCGNIGSHLAREIQRSLRRNARLIGLYDTNPEAARQLAKSLKPAVPLLSLKSLVRRSQLLIETASPEAVETLLPQVIARGRALLALSTGGLLRRPDLIRKARRRGVRLIVPSGALAGIDGLKAAAVGKILSVKLTTRKPPRSLARAPWVIQRRIRLTGLRRPCVIFSGSAAQATRAFPQNVNVAATLALAGIGPARTRVRVIADPGIRKNVHEVEVRGSFGKLRVLLENRPSRENPKTSQLAVQSAVASLRELFDPVRVGT